MDFSENFLVKKSLVGSNRFSVCYIAARFYDLISAAKCKINKQQCTKILCSFISVKTLEHVAFSFSMILQSTLSQCQYCDRMGKKTHLWDGS